MADDTQQLVYKINVITDGVQGKIAEVSSNLNSVKQTMDKIGASRLEVNTTKSVENFERLSASLREVQKGIELLTRNNNAQIIDLNGLPQTMTSLRLLEMQIQDLQKSIKAASLNEIFKSNQKQQINEVTSALQSQRKAIDDITKSMEQQKAMSQSTYYRRRSDFDSANATLGNYNVAPKDNPYGGSWSDYVKQVQAAGSMRERLEKNIAESQAARQSKANAEENNVLKIEQQRQAIVKARADQELATQKQIQTESKKAYADEQKAMSERSKMLQRDIEERRAAEQKIVAERVKANIAESQSARQSKANAEANNALKIEQQRQAIAKARADQELATQKQIQAESKKAYVDEQKAMSERSKMLQRDIEERRAAEQKIVAERVKANIAESQSARQARSTAELNNSKQLIQLRNQLQNAENAQNAAIARGNQLEVQRYETLRQQYATARQALEARGERVSGSEPMSAAQYANPSAFNQQAAISNAMSWDTRGITSYTNEIGKLQRAQESLYAIYKQDPSPTNLANFSATTARLKEVSEQYRVYQRSIQNTGSTMDQFMVKARSHLAWIASGFTIGALFAIPAETVDTMERIESEMASIKQVMPEIEGKDDSSIAKYNSEMQKFIGIASQYGEAVDKVMDAARSIGRMYGQGDNGIANTNLMTQQAAKMATADAFDMTTATKALESAMAQWGLQTQDTNQLMVNSNRILDTWTITAHRGAASAQDIGNAIEAAGTAAAQAGVSFEFFNALVETGVRATGRSGNEIGQAIKSMMVSMQTDKSAKALKEWGIALDEVGTDGVKRMRSMEDVILDVSMAINSTNKDPSKLLMTLSGGKYQYSKVSAMLKDYKELLRMMGVINSDETVGFTTKQVEVQLDTLKRKMQTVKDDLQGLVMNKATGKDGWLSDLKSVADHIDNIVVGITKMDASWGETVKSILEVIIAIKGLEKLVVMLKTTSAAISLVNSQIMTSQAKWGALQGVVNMFNGTMSQNAKAAAAARLAKQGLISTEDAYVASLGLESTEHKVNTAAQTAESSTTAKATTIKRGATMASRGLAAAEGVAAGATRGLTVAMATFGGPVGIAITALAVLIPMLIMDADAEGEAANAAKQHGDAVEELGEKFEQQQGAIARQGEAAEKLAKQYNTVKDSMSNCAEGSDEYNKKNQELGDLQKTISEILHGATIEYDEDGKIKIKSITDFTEKMQKSNTEHQKQLVKTSTEDANATRTALSDIKQRIAGLEEEVSAVKTTGDAWNWLHKMINNAQLDSARKLKEEAQKMRDDADNLDNGKDSGIFGWYAKYVADSYGGTDVIREKASDLWNEADAKEQAAVEAAMKSNDAGYANGVIAGYVSELKKRQAKLETQLDEQDNTVAKQQSRLDDMQGNGNGNNPDITKRGETGDSNDGSGAGSSGSSSSSTPKAQPWEYGDEASKAMYAVTQQSSIFDKYGVDMPRLMAIASRITGAQGFNFEGTPDIFGMGAANPWDSAYAFATKLNELLSTGKEDLDTALKAITGMDGWDGYLENEKTYLDKNIDFKKHARRFADPTQVAASLSGGEGTTWVKQTSAVSMEGTLAQTQQALEALAKWYKEQTGNPLVLTAGTNGNHADGPTSHGAGYKVDVNSFMNGVDGTLETDAAFREKFREYGHQLGLGMAEEGDHIDVQTTGYEWTTGANYGGFHAPAQQQSNRWNWLGGGGLSSVQRDYIAEEISYQSKRKEAYEQMKKDIERRRKYESDTADVAMQTYINEATHAADLERNAAYWDRIYKTLNDKVSAYIQSHAGILDVLHGSQWHDLTDQEQTEIAKNTNDEIFENIVKGLQEATKQRKTARSDALDARVNADILAGYMNPDELTTYRTDKAKRDYDNTTSGLGSQDTISVIKAKDEAKRIELEAQLSALNEKYSRLEVQYGKAVAAQPSILAELKNNIEAKQVEIKKLTNKSEITAANEELAKMNTLYQQTKETGTQAMRDVAKALEETDTAIKKTSNDLKEVKDKRLMAIREETADVFTQLIVEGRSLHDVLKQIVADIAKMAIRQALGLGGGGILKTILGGAAKGGSIDGYASGGAVRGAGTGRSDSILAYVANKDKFMYLSNGEYVLNSEATKRIGVENLDVLNGYADGGALSPTPYVPSINPVTAKKATSISGNSDTVALLKEQNAKMAEQLTLLKGMGKDGSNGDLVVLNTQASSADVLKALQENPRAVQALMGQQRRAGFR